MALEFLLLGEVQARVDGRPVELGHARQQCVLAALLVDANRSVPIDILLDRVWGERPPQRARNALSGYISRLRRLFAQDGDVAFVRHHDGYRITVDPNVVDLYRFRRLLDQARSGAAGHVDVQRRLRRRDRTRDGHHRSGTGRPGIGRRTDGGGPPYDELPAGSGRPPDGEPPPDGGEPVALLERALSLWRGEPFGTLDTAWLTAVRTTLAAERLAAELQLTEWALAQGRHSELLGQLTARAAEHPLDERIAGQLMTALYRCGRQADALRYYQDVRSRLAEAVGMDPSTPLRTLYHRILIGDAALDVAAATAQDITAATAQDITATTAQDITATRTQDVKATTVAELPGSARADAQLTVRGLEAGGSVPQQLPAPATAFTGRERELAELDALVDGSAGTGGTAVLSGSAGVGKSTLAVYWAHRNADRFPDGQLYVNLRGFDADDAVVGPEEAVRGFLDAFGVPARRMPIGLAAQTALYRSLVAGRRVLVVLDNARDAAQARHLLPGTATCVSVVTSRNQLGGLVAIDGAHPVTLDLFTDLEARHFLGRRLGTDRVADEPTAVDEIVARCARLPLALAVVAARAASHRGFRLADLATELRSAGGGLDPFDGGEPAADVRSVFSWSYQALSPAAARMFRLIGLHPGPGLSAAAAACLACLPVGTARRSLVELARAHLITERSPGRYLMHDLLRAYAVERAEFEDSESVRRAAAERLLDHYLHTAYAADRVLYPHREPIVLAEPVPGAGPQPLADRAEAMSWLRAERETLCALTDWASRLGFDRHTWELAWSLTSFFNLSGYWRDQIVVQRTALAAAERLGDHAARAHTHRNLGRAHTQLGDLERARFHLDLALELFVAVGDRANQAQTEVNTARILERQGRDIEALHHDQRSLDLYREVGHLTGQARALNNIACMLGRLGDHELARELCRQALGLNEELGNRHGAATNWQSLGNIDLDAGAHPDAVTGCLRALELFEEVGDRGGVAETLMCLGEARQALGEVRAATEAWQRALPLLDEMGHPDADRVRGHLRGPARPTAGERHR